MPDPRRFAGVIKYSIDANLFVSNSSEAKLNPVCHTRHGLMRMEGRFAKNAIANLERGGGGGFPCLLRWCAGWPGVVYLLDAGTSDFDSFRLPEFRISGDFRPSPYSFEDYVLFSPGLLRGGLKTKVLEAFAFGCVVIGNEVTFEGLHLDG